MFVSFKWGRKAAELRGCYLWCPEKGVLAPFSLVCLGNYASFIVFLIFYLLPRYALYPLLGSKRAVSFLPPESILLVLYKYDCSHLIQLRLSRCIGVWFGFVLDSLWNLHSGTNKVVQVSSWFSCFNRNTVVSQKSLNWCGNGFRCWGRACAMRWLCCRLGLTATVQEMLSLLLLGLAGVVKGGFLLLFG